jgi:1,4-alpha-glucan branching enzyme
VREIDGVTGLSFAVWAPSARSVSVVGDFNSWDGRLHPMRSIGSSGIWELFLPAVEPGARYKFEILAQSGEIRLKADPLAFATELPLLTASVVHQRQHKWNDGAWLQERRTQDPHGSSSAPLAVDLSPDFRSSRAHVAGCGGVIARCGAGFRGL